jgi:hypothetical protein
MSDHEITKLVDLILKQKKQSDIQKQLKFSDILSSILSKLDLQKQQPKPDLKIIVKKPTLSLKSIVGDSVSIPPVDVRQSQFPTMKPTPPPGTDTFPYDGMTVATMNSPFKGRSKSLTTAKVAEPGSQGSGLQQKTNFKSSGNMSTSAGSWNTKGVAGWSRSLPNQEFDLPNELPDDLKKPTIGSFVPKFTGLRNLNRSGAKSR